MPDSAGISQTGLMHKLANTETPPKYVTRVEVAMDGVPGDHRRGVSQPRNERCACGSGRKYKLCCGK